MHAVHWSPLFRRLVLATGLALVALLLGARAAAGAEPERKNCPAGFVWVRMSGTACVQEKLPPNGRIGYDGHAICNDEYVGIYEFRPTKDGSPPPGAPYTAFSYLLECVTPEEKARRVAAASGHVNEGQLAQFLAENLVRFPRTEELVILGITAAGTVLAAAGAIKGAALGGAATSVRLAVPGGSPPFGPTLVPAAPPTPGVIPGLDESLPQDVTAERRAEVAGEIAADPKYQDLVAIDDRIRQLMERVASEADPSRWRLADVLEVGGDIAAVLSLIPGLSLPAGVISLIGTIGSAAAGQYSTEEVDEARRTLIEQLSMLRGRLASERDAVVKEYATGVPAHPPEEPPRTPAEEEASRTERRERDSTTLRGLDNGALDAERQRRTDGAVEALEKLQEADRRVADLERAKRELDIRHDVLNNWIELLRGTRGASLVAPGVSVPTGAVATDLARGDATTRAALVARASEEAREAWDWMKALKSGDDVAFLPGTTAQAAQAGLGGVSAAANVASLADWEMDRATEQNLGEIHAITSRLEFVRGRFAADLERAVEQQAVVRRAYETAVFDRRTAFEEFFRRCDARAAAR